jgi:hypothetical protein
VTEGRNNHKYGQKRRGRQRKRFWCPGQIFNCHILEINNRK